MFERFTEPARAVVVGAQEEARSLGHRWIGTEHLLLAAVGNGGTPVAETLGRLGITYEAVRRSVLDEIGSSDWPDDSLALRDLGIDLDEVRRRVEERFGPGALDVTVETAGRRWWRHRRPRHCTSDQGRIPFTRRAKQALELALREAIQLRSHEIGVAHLVLGTMRTDGLATLLITRLGVPPVAVRAALLEQLGRAA